MIRCRGGLLNSLKLSNTNNMTSTNETPKSESHAPLSGVTDRFLIRSKYCGTLVSDVVMAKDEVNSIIEYYNSEAKKLESDVRYEAVHENDL